MTRRGSAAHPLRDLALAASTLTALPIAVTWPEGERTDAPGYYPLVGLGLGASLYALVALLRFAGWGGGAPLVIAAVLVGLVSVFTRMLHWDGLGDAADGYWAHDQQRRLEIMSDSAIGAYAVVAIVVVIVVHVASIAAILPGDRVIALLVVPVFGRLAATFGAWLGTPAKPAGLGASVVGRPALGAALPAGAAIAIVTALAVVSLGAVEGGVLTVLGVLSALAVPHLLSQRFGGVTGDVLGASVVLVEALLFAVVAVWW